MALYNLTYQFESGGGNIEYQTTQQVRKEATKNNTDITLVTTGLSIADDVIEGIAIVDTHDDIAPTDIFESAINVGRVSAEHNSGNDGQRLSEPELATDPQPPGDIDRFEACQETSDLLARTNETPGHGFLLASNLTLWYPHEHDLWLVELQSTEIDAETGLTAADVVEFYRENIGTLDDDPTLKIGGYHEVAEPTIKLSLVATLTDPREAKELAGQVDSAGPINVYRFEFAKASLVIGESTHGPGQVTALFRNEAGEEVCSRDLAYRCWHEGLDVSYHPLGVVVDRDLYRPVVRTETEATTVSDPISVDTYRGSESKPWQFGVTRDDDHLLITQARGPPKKFDPVLKRFPVETRTLGDEPLVFSHTVSRRVWSEDPLNTHVRSHRSEGLRTQFLYADNDGWHLIQPKALGEPKESPESSFESTQLPGVTVRSALLRAETDGEMKATVEHEYRITGDVFDSCSRVYALSYHEANEESIDQLQWEIADSTAYEIVTDRHCT